MTFEQRLEGGDYTIIQWKSISGRNEKCKGPEEGCDRCV